MFRAAWSPPGRPVSLGLSESAQAEKILLPSIEATTECSKHPDRRNGFAKAMYGTPGVHLTDTSPARIMDQNSFLPELIDSRADWVD